LSPGETKHSTDVSIVRERGTGRPNAGFSTQNLGQREEGEGLTEDPKVENGNRGGRIAKRGIARKIDK
jgi:hypothetical protein